MIYQNFKKYCHKSSLTVGIFINSLIFAQPIQQTLHSSPDLINENIEWISSFFFKDSNPKNIEINLIKSIKEEPMFDDKLKLMNSLPYISKKAALPQLDEVEKQEGNGFQKIVFQNLLKIGTSNGNKDDIRDNYVRFDLKDWEQEVNKSVILRYDLVGLKSEKSVCLSINDSKAIGGSLIEFSKELVKVETRLPSFLFKEGRNTLLFSRGKDQDFSYQISNLQITVNDDANIQDSKNVLLKEFYESDNYIRFLGFAAPKVTKLKIGEVYEQINGSIFDFTYLKSDSIKNIIPFRDNEKQTAVDFKNVTIINTTDKDIIINSSEDKINSAAMAIRGEDYYADQSYTVQGLEFKQVKPLGQDLVNVTKGDFSSYRVKQKKRDSIQATRLRIPFDINKIPDGYSIKDVTAYKFNDDKMQWERVNDAVVDQDSDAVIFELNGDTDYINGVIKVPESPESSSFVPTSISDIEYANPGSGIVNVSPPQANSSGAASTSFPIKLPSSRGGFAPNISLSYSSDGGNGWLGMGWNISQPAITLDTRWGTPKFDPSYESEIYSMNGQQLTFEEVGDYISPQFSNTRYARSVDRVFYVRKEGAFLQITRYGNNVNNYYWKVVDKSGTSSYYGGVTSVNSNATIRKNGTTGPITHWALVKQVDSNGNSINYTYINNLTTIALGDANITVSGTQFYPNTITYNHSENGGSQSYKVTFLFNSGQKRDATINYKSGRARIDKLLCARIVISENESQERIRTYNFNYQLSDLNKNLLESITERDLSNNNFYTNRFDYYDDAQVNSEALVSNRQSGENPTWVSPTYLTTLGLVNETGINVDELTISSLGGSTASGFNVGLRAGAGIGANPTRIDGTIGGGYNYSKNTNKTRVSLIDIDGDGLADKVYDQGQNQLRFYKNIGDGFESTDYSISGADNLMKSTSRTNSTSVDANINIGPLGVGKGKGWSTTRSTTENYFQDFNGDGFIDMTVNQRVKFNDEGVSLLLSSDLVHSTSIHPGILEDLELPMRDHIRAEHPQFDHVQVWKAPYSGNIGIVANATLLELNNCTSSNQVRFSIEQARKNNDAFTSINNNAITVGSISSTAPFVQNLTVEKGDFIFFRSHNIQYGCGAKVTWDPTVSYTGSSLNIQAFQDENSLNPRSFDATDDFYYNGSGVHNPEISSTGISASFNMTQAFRTHLASIGLTDNVDFVIQQTEFEHQNTTDNESMIATSSSIDERVVTYDPFSNTFTSSADVSFSHNSPHFTESVPLNGIGYSYSYKFYVRSTSNVNWKEIKWRPIVLGNNGGEVVSAHYQAYNDNANAVETRYALITFPHAVLDPNVVDDQDSDFIEFSNDIALGNLHIQQKIYSILQGDRNNPKHIVLNWVTKAYSTDQNYNPTEILHKKSFLIKKTSCDAGSNICYFLIEDMDVPGVLYDNTQFITPEMKNFKISKGEWNRIKTSYDYITSAFYVDDAEFGVNSDLDIDIELVEDNDPNGNSYNFSKIDVDQPFYAVQNEVYGPGYRAWGQFLYNGGITYNYDNEGNRGNINNNYGNMPISGTPFFQTVPDNANNSIDDQGQGSNVPLLFQYNLVPDSNAVNFDTDCFKNDQIIHKERDDVNVPTQYASLAMDAVNNRLVGVMGRFGESSIYNVYVDPDDLVIDAYPDYFPALDLRTFSKGDSKSGNLGLTINNVPGNGSGTKSFAYSKNLLQYIDMNGDRFPDMITSGNILYTTLRGGYENVPVAIDFITGSENSDETYGASIAGNEPNSSAVDNTNTSATNPTNTNGSSGLSNGSGVTYNFKQYLDMNGDGLPDQVSVIRGDNDDSTNNHRIEVKLNTDQSFSQPFQWASLQGLNLSEISKRDASSLSIGGGASVNTNGSFAIGYGLNTSQANIKMVLTDVTGDGLPDLVYKSASTYYYLINKGTRLDTTRRILTTNGVKIDEDRSLSANIYGSFTYGFVFPFFGIPFKVTATATAGLNTSINNKLSTLQDINGDGLPDALTRSTSGSDDVISAQINQMGRTHLLKTAYLPLGGKWEVDYERSGNNIRNPHNKYVLKSLRTHDGFAGDNSFKIDETLTLFDYQDGHFDRGERDFLGFGVVGTERVDPQSPTTVHARQEVEYHNENIYSAGLAKTIRSYDAAGELVSLVENTYELKNRNNLSVALMPVDDSFNILYDKVVCPKLIHTMATTYEGTDSLSIEQSYDSFNSFGDITQYTNYGDTQSLGAGDDGYTTLITYAPKSDSRIAYAPSRPAVIEVKKLSDLSLSRKRNATYEGINIKTVTVELNDTESVTKSFNYDAYGNMTASSVDLNNTTYTTTVAYDPQYHIYPVRVTNAFNEVSEAQYNYKFGVPTVITDVNRKRMVNQYDDRGRMVKVRAPGDEWTIHMQYENEVNDPALGSNGLYNATHHFNAQQSSSYSSDRKHHALTRHHIPGVHQDQLLTVSLVDGLGQPIQVKKTNYYQTSSTGGLNWMIDGKKRVDTFGNVLEQFIPSFANNYPTDVNNIPASSYDYEAAITTIMPEPAVYQYDSRDRPIAIQLPGNSTQSTTAFSIEDGMAKTTLTNENGQVSSTFTDVRGRMRRQVTEGLTTWFWYDHLGQKIKANNAQGYESKYWYDRAGRRIQELHPDRGATYFKYDLLGNLIERRTSNIMSQSDSDFIEYVYDFNRLTEINYPFNPDNKVRYFYGDSSSRTERNVIGRLSKQSDASGVHYFNYDDLGNLSKALRGVTVPGRQTYWFLNQWEYDNFGRMKQIIYPDGELVNYNYNEGGNLQAIDATIPQGGKRPLLTEVYYNKIGEKMGHEYGNGTIQEVKLDAQRRIQQLNHGFNDFTVASVYEYDGISNITKVRSETGGLLDPGKLGGPMYHEYTYDNFNRLDTAIGRYTGTNDDQNHLAQAYTLIMEYDDAHNIKRKTQQHLTGIVTDHAMNAPMLDEQAMPLTSYDLKYEEHAEGAFSVTTPLGDVSYVQPHAPRLIIETPDDATYNPGDEGYQETHLDYDANGNLLSNTLVVNYEDNPDARDGIIHQDTTLVRTYLWDEENRLRGVNLDPEKKGSNAIAIYTYDASGERVIKHIPTRLDVLQQHKEVSKNESLVDRIYPSTLVNATALNPVDNGEGGQTLDPVLRYTKHYFMGASRFASALGTARELGLYDEKLFETDAFFTPDRAEANQINNQAYAALKDTYIRMKQDHRVPENVVEQDGNPYLHNMEEKVSSYWYHADHLGSSSYITDNKGHVTQHMEYLPFGETLVEEHLNSNNSPYKFNGKEQDAETGNYYYGARYYDPKLSFWLSVDPLAEKYYAFSPYAYVMNNPIRYTDPTGMSHEDPIYGTNFWGNLEYLGDDGKNNGRVYFVSGQTKRDVKKATANGETYSGSLESSDDVSSVPSQMIFAVAESLQATNTSDRENGGHNTFSSFETTQWDEGPEVEQLEVEAGTMTRGSVTPFVVDGNTVDVNMEDLDVYYHLHPNTKGLGNSSPSNYSSTVGNRTIRRGDVPYQAGLERQGYNGNPFVVGARDNRVRFYNGNGSVMKVKYDQFQTALLSEFVSHLRF